MAESIIRFRLNGREVEAAPEETLLQVAEREGVELPHLCTHPSLRNDGNCRSCVVEIEGERVLAPSCCRHPVQGMAVDTDTPRAIKARRTVIELLRADMPEQGRSPWRGDSELDHWADRLKIGRPRFAMRDQPPADLTHPAIAVHLDACIQCNRCLRACREEQGNDVIGYALRGSRSRIVFDLDDSLGASSCVACGECVQVCPTGALMPATEVAMPVMERQVESLCPYCGVGCLVTYHLRHGQIRAVTGRDGATNRSRLCVKGRFGFDYIRHPDRLRRPLIRREDAPKTEALVDPADMDRYFREASWEEALDRAAEGFRTIRETHGGEALGGFGSAKGSNEEAYLFQKLVRCGFGSNHVDHCTRLCHASSVAALLEGIGSGAVSNPVADVAQAEVLFIIGSNTTVNHPVAATWMKNAARHGAKLIVADPVRTELMRHATHALQFHPDTDVALLNGIMHAIIDEKLCDESFIAERTEGFEALKRHLADYPPERVAPVCGIDAETLREVARLYAGARSAMIFWGMGISQHVHGTDNARCLIALALMSGQIGRPGTGLHPLRGQNNVQGASDVGLIPMFLPDYQAVSDGAARAGFEKLWGCRLSDRPGMTVVEIMHAIEQQRIRGMYIMGENPAMSDPNLARTRAALARLDHLVVQDLFLTETAGFADVVLPASAFAEKTGSFTNTDRRVQLGREVVEPPGEARQDLWIIQQIARRLGLDWNHDGPQSVFEEMRLAMPSISGISWERLQREDSVIYPCTSEDDPGQAVLFEERFPTDTGLGRFVPATFSRADELPDEDYPFVLITGRQLEHWHTGAMTRRATVLDALQPNPVVTMNAEDCASLGLEEGDRIRLETRRNSIVAGLVIDPGMPRGSLFMPFCYREAAANLLTNEALDPVAKIPEFKFCALRVSVAD